MLGAQNLWPRFLLQAVHLEWPCPLSLSCWAVVGAGGSLGEGGRKLVQPLLSVGE